MKKLRCLRQPDFEEIQTVCDCGVQKESRRLRNRTFSCDAPDARPMSEWDAVPTVWGRKHTGLEEAGALIRSPRAWYIQKDGAHHLMGAVCFLCLAGYSVMATA